MESKTDWGSVVALPPPAGSLRLFIHLSGLRPCPLLGDRDNAPPPGVTMKEEQGSPVTQSAPSSPGTVPSKAVPENAVPGPPG